MSTLSAKPVITVQRLYEDDHYKEILDFNLENLNRWKRIYPNHATWIREVIAGLRHDLHTRIAFGGFRYNELTEKNELCCSVIVKKNPYTPYLEIKNLIVFNTKGKMPSEEFRALCQEQLIIHIKKFAEQRGYPKLAAELSNHKRSDRALINIFLKNDFTITGSQSERYDESDEIVFLTAQIEQIYGFDPYDNLSASLWIIGKYLKAEEIKLARQKLTVKTNTGESLDGTTYTFYSGRRFENPIEKKFNSKNQLLIIEEYFKKDSDFSHISKINSADPNLSQLFIFDFSKDNLTSGLAASYPKCFSDRELKTLLYGNKPNRLLRFDYEEIGGMLLISNPAHFGFTKAREVLKNGKSFLYLKLGAAGRYLEDGMPIVFAYYSKDSSRSKIEVWGIGELAEPPTAVDLNDLREKSDLEAIHTSSSNKNTDGDLLFEWLNVVLGEEISESNEKAEHIAERILWDKDEFDKHNAYNATNRVICFSINTFVSLEDERRFIDVQKILPKRNFLQNTENLFDFYLRKSEIIKLKAEISKTQTTQNAAPKAQTAQRNLKILFLANSAGETADAKIIEECQGIKKQFDQSPLYRDQVEVFELPFKASISEITRILEKKPEIIQFCGRTKTKGIMFAQKNMIPQPLSPERIKRLFAPLKGFIKFVFLDGCYSAAQAAELSKYECFVAGINYSAADHTRVKLSKALHFEISRGKDFPAALQIAVAKAKRLNPSLNRVTLWKNGARIKF